MKFLDLKDISERDLELINPSSVEKIITVGNFAGLEPGKRVIDFGSGFAEPLVLWADYFGISGLGIDIRPYACQRAQEKIKKRGVRDRVEIVCASASEYQFEPHGYDVAACLGATFIWGGFEPTIQAMKEAVHPAGRLIVGEPYWSRNQVSQDVLDQKEGIFREDELLEMIRRQSYELAYVVRASQDDWDRYQAGNWQGLLKWLDENPEHPERQQVLDHLHESQDWYLRYGREYLGWAIYVLTPHDPQW